MKQIARRTINGLLALTALSGMANAADVSPIQSSPAPVAGYTWTGLYVDVFFGRVVNTTSEQVSGSTAATPTVAGSPLTGTVSGESNGVLGGVELGYDYQLTPTIVTGVFGEGALADINGGGGISTPQFLITAKNATNYLFAAGARLGWLVTPATLVYAKGGFAGGGAHPDLTAGVTQSINDTTLGWMVGAGMEIRINQNWFGKVDFENYQLGDESLTNFLGHGAYASNTAHYRFSVFKAGFGYHF